MPFEWDTESTGSSTSGDEDYEVSAILGHIVDVEGVNWYLVEWAEYPVSEACWVNERDAAGCSELVDEFHARDLVPTDDDHDPDYVDTDNEDGEEPGSADGLSEALSSRPPRTGLEAVPGSLKKLGKARAKLGRRSIARAGKRAAAGVPQASDVGSQSAPHDRTPKKQSAQKPSAKRKRSPGSAVRSSKRARDSTIGTAPHYPRQQPLDARSKQLLASVAASSGNCNPTGAQIRRRRSQRILPPSLRTGGMPKYTETGAAVGPGQDRAIMWYGGMPGTYVFQDDDEGETVFMLRVTLLEGMGESELGDVTFLGEEFHRVLKHSLPIKSNRAHAAARATLGKSSSAPKGTTRPGRMDGIGWRLGYDGGGPYKPNQEKLPKKPSRKGKKKQTAKRNSRRTTDGGGKWTPEQIAQANEVMSAYIASYNALPRIADIYRRRFIDLAPKLHLRNKELYEERPDLPSLSQTEVDVRPDDYLAASNLTLTCDDFNNTVHVDSDASIATYGMWIHTRESSGELIRNKSEIDWQNDSAGVGIRGGEFIVPEYGIGVKFELPALYELVWRGPKDAHGTMSSITGHKADIRRWGTSVQLTTRLANRFSGDQQQKKPMAGFRDRVDEKSEFYGKWFFDPSAPSWS
ncbi:hypothetical protein EXIGLDRAFT_758618 [Exidia glandulosa HHB12029]|uniref:Chromo domain-containing protein n=1 Tax=Exidia glandulosa HHB12029 TaxID=1314781 RepID=A0A165R0K2_EXIGL|nr:hypothetical protein EXIGLDRAFT_758618 [Exidia glandulosa HHB12029]